MAALHYKPTEADMKNISITIKSISDMLIIDRNTFRNDVLTDFEKNPLGFLKRQGLKRSLVSIIKKTRNVYQEFQDKMRFLLRKWFQNPGHIPFDKCFQCIVGLIFILTIVMAANGVDLHALLDATRWLSDLLSEYLSIAFGLYVVGRLFIRELQKSGVPIPSLDYLAELICRRLGVCDQVR